MLQKFLIALMVLLPLNACSDMDVGLLMEQYLWEKRVLLIFTPNAQQEDFAQQHHILQQHHAGIKERDIVVWYMLNRDRVIIDGEAKPQFGTPALYKYFTVNPHRYTAILLGKDGNEKLRSTTLVESNTLFNLIDTMPMRQHESKESL